MNHLSSGGKEIKRDSPSSGERRGRSPNRSSAGLKGRAGGNPGSEKPAGERNGMGRPAAEGESPVREPLAAACARRLSRAGHEEPRLNPGRPRSKAEHPCATDSGRVPRGKGEKNPGEGSETEPETMDRQDVAGARALAACLL